MRPQKTRGEQRQNTLLREAVRSPSKGDWMFIFPIQYFRGAQSARKVPTSKKTKMCYFSLTTTTLSLGVGVVIFVPQFTSVYQLNGQCYFHWK